MDKRYQVFISSTYSDLKEERGKVMQTIMSLDCIPAGMELFPANDDEQFEFIKKVIDDCDYYVLIIGGRYGSISPDGISYTEKEFDYAISKKTPVVAFLHEDIGKLTVEKSDVDPTKRSKLIAFRDRAATGRLVQFWSNADDLNGKVAVSLTKTIKTHPAIGWIRANLQTNAESLHEMNELRKELAELKEYKTKIEQEQEKNKSLIIQSIAGLDEIITINGTRKEYAHKTSYNVKWSVEITWRELFAKISPFFLQAQNDGLVDKIILKAFGYSEYSSNVDIQDFQTIKIQFKTLGLFDVRYVSTTNGGKALFWFLTDRGNQLMVETRIIKTQI